MHLIITDLVLYDALFLTIISAFNLCEISPKNAENFLFVFFVLYNRLINGII
tara:strand:+ start:315 stop:470 length:156 start_codon:yes stop_codon:yes gene_type:complete